MGQPRGAPDHLRKKPKARVRHEELGAERVERWVRHALDGRHVDGGVVHAQVIAVHQHRQCGDRAQARQRGLGERCGAGFRRWHRTRWYLDCRLARACVVVAPALVPAVSRLRTPDVVEPGVSSLSTGQWYAHRRPGDSGKHFCPASAYVPLNERCCKMLRRLIRELFPAITTVTIGRCEEWVSLSSSTARSSGATSGVRSLFSIALPRRLVKWRN